MVQRKALLIEDNENNRYLLTLLLQAVNVAVVVAETGHVALEIARKERPDCVLLDIQMPELDGYEIATRLKADPELSRIPIVGVSSFAMPGDREKAMRMGFAGYIEKPVDPENFAATVLAILERGAETS
jgi:CheY-like chemotaxis protein